jgi:serine/threonine-protein kinase ULK4
MAPELFHDAGVHSYYSDFWSLGCILYELAAGKPPFSSNSLKDLIAMIVESECALPVEGTSSEFNDLLRRMLEKDPMKRISWEEIKVHPFWSATPQQMEFTKRSYPQ